MIHNHPDHRGDENHVVYEIANLFSKAIIRCDGLLFKTAVDSRRTVNGNNFKIF